MTSKYLYSKSLFRMVCPILSLKSIKKRHAIKWSKAVKFLEKIISPRIDATSLFIALRRYIGRFGSLLKALIYRAGHFRVSEA